jgi:hypothetical protein
VVARRFRAGAAALLALACGELLPGCATASLQPGGWVAAEGRAFVLPPRYPGQESGIGASLVTEPELSLRSGDERHSVVLRPFYRLDPTDEQRSHADLRQAAYRLSGETLQLGAGAGVFTWGVLESHRPTDVMNQLDFVEALDGSAKLGQPYIEVGFAGEAVSLSLYYLPYFRERTFPGVRGRLRFGTLIDVEHPQFETGLKQWQPSGAARLTFNAGDFDFGMSLFSGLSREPRFILELTNGQVVPAYDLAHQLSVELQGTTGAFTFKAEGYARLWSRALQLYGGGGVGVDYTFFQLLGEADLTLVVEGQYDSRPLNAPITFFDHDAFLGLRVGFNDVASTTFLAGGVVDVLTRATFLRMNASRRFGEHWRASLDLNLFFGSPGTLQGSFIRDNYGQLAVVYYF